MLKGRTLLATVSLPDGEPTLERARQLLGLAPDEVDEAYGLVPLSSDRSEYALLVTEEAAYRLRSTGGADIFSNPRIAPFGM